MMDKAIKVIAALGSIICGGYMIYQGESLGWIIAGFVGGIFVPFAILGAIVGLFQGLFGKNTSTPAYMFASGEIRQIASVEKRQFGSAEIRQFESIEKSQS